MGVFKKIGGFFKSIPSKIKDHLPRSKKSRELEQQMIAIREETIKRQIEEEAARKAEEEKAARMDIEYFRRKFYEEFDYHGADYEEIFRYDTMNDWFKEHLDSDELTYWNNILTNTKKSVPGVVEILDT